MSLANARPVALVTTAAGFLLLRAGDARSRVVVTAGVAVLFVAVSALREARRVHRIEWRPTLDDAQGFPLFVAFLVGGVVAIVWCARLVTRNLR